MDTKERTEEQEIHYDAFISYRHVELDSFVAERLHKMLERYHIPTKIQKRIGKKRINRVFRDREELPLSADLGENISRALQNSDFLIVICSPEALESRWVQSEISLFLESHSLEQILAVLVRGEPEDAFPERLCYKEEKVVLTTGEEGFVRTPVEPLASDVRGETRKKVRKKLRNEFLRLVAPMISCTYDELKQRRQEYRFKQLAAASVVLIAILAVVLSLSIVSYRQYQSAKIYQARYMTEISDQLLSEGNQTEALQSLLSVQPQNDRSEPLIPEQVYALNNALYSYRYTNQLLFKKNAYYELDSQTEENNSGMEQKFSPGGEYYLTIDSNGTAYFLDGDKGNCKWKVRPADLDEASYDGEDFYWGSPVDDEKAALISSEKVFIVDVTGENVEEIISLPEGVDVYDLEGAVNKQYIAIISDEKLLYIYSLSSEKWDDPKSIEDLSEEYVLMSDVSIILTEEGDKLIISFYSSGGEGGVFVFSIQEGKFTRLAKTAAKAINTVGSDRLIALLYDGNEYYVACYNLKNMKEAWKVKELEQNWSYGDSAGIFTCSLKIQERYDIISTENSYTYKLRSKNLTVTAVYLGKYLYCFDLDTGELLRTQDYPWEIAGVSWFDDTTLLVSLSSGEIYAHLIGWESYWGEDDYSYLDIYNSSNVNHEYLHKIGDVGTDVNSFAYNAEERTVVQEENGTHRIYYSSINEDREMKDLIVEEYNVSVRYFKTEEEVFRCILYTTDDSVYGIRIYKAGSSEILYQTELEEDWDFEDQSIEIGMREDKPVLCFITKKSNESESSEVVYQLYMVDLTAGKLLGKSEFCDPGISWSGARLGTVLYLDSMKTILAEYDSGGYCTVDISGYKWGNVEKWEEVGDYSYIFSIDDATVGVIDSEFEGSYEESNLKYYKKLSVWEIKDGTWEMTIEHKKEYENFDDILYLKSFGSYDGYVLTGNKNSYVLTGNKEKLLAVNYDREIQIINWELGTVISDIPVESEKNYSNRYAGFLNDDKQLVILYPEEGRLEVWDMETEKLLMQEQIDSERSELVLDSNGKYFGVKEDPGLSASIYESNTLQKDDRKNLLIYFIEEDGSVYHYADVPYGYASFEAGEILSIPDNYSGTCRYTAMYSFEDLCEKANKILDGNNQS